MFFENMGLHISVLPQASGYMGLGSICESSVPWLSHFYKHLEPMLAYPYFQTVELWTRWSKKATCLGFFLFLGQNFSDPQNFMGKAPSLELQRLRQVVTTVVTLSVKQRDRQHPGTAPG